MRRWLPSLLVRLTPNALRQRQTRDGYDRVLAASLGITLDDTMVPWTTSRCREDLRHFLRGLSEVQDFSAAAQRHKTEMERDRPSAGMPELRTRFAASMNRLRALHNESWKRSPGEIKNYNEDR